MLAIWKRPTWPEVSIFQDSLHVLWRLNVFSFTQLRHMESFGFFIDKLSPDIHLIENLIVKKVEAREMLYVVVQLQFGNS